MQTDFLPDPEPGNPGSGCQCESVLVRAVSLWAHLSTMPLERTNSVTTSRVLNESIIDNTRPVLMTYPLSKGSVSEYSHLGHYRCQHKLGEYEHSVHKEYYQRMSQ